MWEVLALNTVGYLTHTTVSNLGVIPTLSRAYNKTIKYELIGLVICLNDGQREGSLGFYGRLNLFLPNARSRLEPIGQYGEQQFIYHREL